MSSAQERFEAAVNVIKGLPKNGPYQPSNSMMLNFYGLYKQATEGSCEQRKPAFWDVVNRAKWAAWSRNCHLTKEEAMQKYVENLQEIIETMSFTVNVQNFVGSLQDLENINLDELEKIAPGMKELAESHPNSPFNSRTNSPQHCVNQDINSNDHESGSNNASTPTIPSVHKIDLASQSSTLLHSNDPQANGLSQSDQSDDEYVDPFDIQNELHESLQRNTDILKHVQATVVRMNSDLVAVNQRVSELERTLRDMKKCVIKQRNLKENVFPKWWPFSDISPVWFALLILWPFLVRAGRSITYSRRHK